MKLNLQNGQQALRAYCPNIYTVVDSFTEKKGISQCKTLLFYDRKNWVLYVNRRRSSIETAFDIKHIQNHLPTSSSSLSFWTTPYVHSLYIHWEKKVPLNAKYYSKMGWNQFWNRHSYFDLWLNWTINTARSFLFQKIKLNKKMNAPSELKSTNCDLFFTIESIERVAIAISFFFFFPLTPLFTLKPFRNITSLHFNARFEGIHKLLRNFMQFFLVIKIFLKSIHYKRHAFWFFTSQKSNTFVEIIQNIIGKAKIWTHDQQIRSPSC